MVTFSVVIQIFLKLINNSGKQNTKEIIAPKKAFIHEKDAQYIRVLSEINRSAILRVFHPINYFAGLYFPYFTTFRHKNLQFY